MNKFIARLNNETLSFQYDNVAQCIYVYRIDTNRHTGVGIQKCLDYNEFISAVERLKGNGVEVIKDI